MPVDSPEVAVGAPLEIAPEGRLMICPICKVAGLMVGFAASRAAREMLKFAATEVSVSPAVTVYVPPAGIGAGVVGVGVGTTGTGVTGF